MIHLNRLAALCVAFVLTISSAFASEVAPQYELIVTAASDSEFAQILETGSSVDIEQHLGLSIADIQISDYVHRPLLDAIDRRLNSQMFLRQEHPSLSFLKRTFVVSTNSEANFKALHSMLQNRVDIEHLEIAPERSILVECIEEDPLANDQYHLSVVKAPEAWAELSNEEVVIAIVDTGVDYLHEDLRDVIYENPGETGLDNQGLDKRTNGKDDDNNGFVDDFQGWDMYHFNNHPLPGNGHGTHVAGIAGAATCNGIGVAGVFPRARIMPLKIGPDEAATITWRGHAAILYAAYQGADVINCSWGGSDYSLSEQHIVQLASDLGSFIVAAAGNAGTDAVNYPAAYHEVFSVANTDETDFKVGNSSYHVSVDVSAPGARILSTLPDNDYAGPAWTGTSMSSPVVAGVAAMVLQLYPHLSKQQLAAWLRTSVDDVYTFNQQYLGKLGSGRINAQKALDNTKARKAMSLANIRLFDENDDGHIRAGEKVQISFNATNHFDALSDATIRVVGADNIGLDLIDQTADVGPMSSGQVYLTELGTFEMTVPSEETAQRIAFLRVEFLDNGEVFDWDFIRVVINQGHVTIAENNTAVSLSGDGRLGYTDYPTNEIGDGLRGDLTESILYAGGLMVGSDKSHVSNAVLNKLQTPYTTSFVETSAPELNIPGERAQAEVFVAFTDGEKFSDVGVDIELTAYQYTAESMANRTILKYNVTNTSGFNYDELYCGLMFDIDISPFAGSDNFDIVTWAQAEQFGIVYSDETPGYPLLGMSVVSPHDPNFLGLLNYQNNTVVIDGQSTSINLNNFTIEDKWNVLRAGVDNPDVGPADISASISAGPFGLEDGQSTDVVFVLFFASSLEELVAEAQKAREDYNRVTSVDNAIVAHEFSVFYANDEVVIRGVHAGPAHIHIVDVLGNVLYSDDHVIIGSETVVPFSITASGTYIVQYSNERGSVSHPIQIVR